MAMAGKTTIAEVDEIVPLGELDPESDCHSGNFCSTCSKKGGDQWIRDY